ncbi:rhomboid family intramembrane serine protease [Pseudoteredinibacter isoporae]|uniref:Membrane associated rhomboid family serine protease n=1 Tax=Pseudoteredinibacter isoporae TaxID=570281 RepID=A0A7X0MY81_9GAMM|nr:rhomboid family intramembrane serine protease [Pseudoteredinibacter isoporae]MBB6521732.1 membrane associated rhomboid family serine protease [Pseudoteredinibacter isoporae]NHO87280.1 rhomboid family intramembrane serine protease [Pseudoteredinibacter isoporae]NIB23088.1 rhomboid family intramembrane serine protease [Pseudoteredinibacter isoporae]
MIIIPTEKPIDWRRPPIAVIALILINIAIFAFYQSGDHGKYLRAYELYESNEFAQFEAAAYLNYRKQNGILQGDPELYDQLSNQFDNDPSSLSQVILLDRDFLAYLSKERHQWIPKDKLASWDQVRPNIERNIAGISSIELGLIPQHSSLITVFSHQFLHGDIMHLVGNMLFLFICGFAVEAAIGPLRFLLLYIASGVGAGLIYSGIEVASSRGGIPLVGASGAISGVMAMYLMLFRLKKIEFFYWILIFIGYFRAAALFILPLYIAKELAQYFFSDDSQVAYMAHVGGFICGAALLALVQWQRPESIDEEFLEEDPGQDPRRESLQNVLQKIEAIQFRAAHKAIIEHQKEYGACIESDFIAINLMSLNKDPAWLTANIDYLKRSQRDQELLVRQLTLWKRLSEKERDQIDELSRSQFAMRLLDAGYNDNAELIAIELFKNESKEPMLAKLLGRLAVFYRNCENPGKAQKFEQALEQQLQRSL